MPLPKKCLDQCHHLVPDHIPIIFEKNRGKTIWARGLAGPHGKHNLSNLLLQWYGVKELIIGHL